MKYLLLLIMVAYCQGDQDTEVVIEKEDPEFKTAEDKIIDNLRNSAPPDDGITLHGDSNSDTPSVQAGEGTVDDRMHPSLMCHQCVQWIIGTSIRTEDKFERKLSECPTKACWKNDTICATLEYDVGNAKRRKHGCVHESFIDTPCPNMKCNKWETQCLSLKMEDKTVLDCGYDKYLGRDENHICKKLQGNINYAITNCTVKPSETSCVCGAIMVNMSLSLIALTLTKLIFL